MTLDPRGDEPGRFSSGARRYLFVAAALAVLLPALASAYFFTSRQPHAIGQAIVEGLLVFAVGLVGLLHLLIAGVYAGSRHRDPAGWAVATVAGVLLALGALGVCLLAIG